MAALGTDGARPAHDPAAPRLPRSLSLIDRIAAWARVTTVSFAVIAIALVTLIIAVNRVYEPRLRHSVEASLMLRRTHDSMLDQEASLRAFLVSSDERFLSPYRRAAAQLDDLNGQVKALLGSSATTSALLLDVLEAETAWIEGWVPDALTTGRRRAGSRDVDELLIEGKDLFDAYRAADDALVAELAQRREDAIDAQSRVLLLTAGLTLLATFLMAGSSVARSRQLQGSVGPPLSAIQAHLARIASGDFTDGPPIRGPAELQQINAGINVTSRALAEAHVREAAQVERTQTQNRQLAQVLRVAREIAGSLNLGYVVRGVCSAASTIADGRRVVIWLRSDDGVTLDAGADSAHPGLEPVGLEPVALGEGTVGRAARYGRVDGHREASLDDGNDRGDDTSVAMPMVVGAEVIGVLEVVGPGVHDLPTGTLDVLEALAVQAASAVASARLHEHTEVLAMTDALTHLPNRRRLEADLDTEVGVSTRYGRPLGFAMLDVDHFKAYNDALGHQAADTALQELAHLLASSVRAGDTVYRYGGEEIALVMRETTSEAARDLAERMRANVVHHFADPRSPRPLTVSIGVATIPDHAKSAAPLIAAADGALYEAKRRGRNRVCLAPIPPPDALPTDA